jgi:serine/threonine protein kinase
MVYVAEGTYGCVYRPPIKCKNGKKYTTGKVSKLMTRYDAKKEIDEYKIIKTVDKNNKYYPGPPIGCEPDPIDAKNEMRTGECKLFEKNPNISNYKLLIYNDGGYDLDKFVKTQLDIYLKPNPQEQTDLFFLHAYNLFEGIRLFLKNDLLHHDIKPQNIVFDPSTYRFNYIDFGLAEKKSVLYSEIIDETNHENFHWSYPLEFGLLNHSKVYYFKNLDETRLTYIKDELTNLLLIGSNTSNLYNIKPSSFKTTFRYMENRVTHFNQDKFVKNVFDGLRSYIYAPNETYPLLVERLLKNTDIYALGFTMNYMINSFYDNNALSQDEYIQYSELFQQMFYPDVNVRTSFDIYDYATEYVNILKNTGVLSRLNKNIVDGQIVDASPSFANASPSFANASPSFANASPIKRCPEGKELNLATKRCRKLCPPNYYRDAKQNCKKNKVVESESVSNFSMNAMIDRIGNQLSSATRKNCPPWKELNLITGRCRNKCNPGTVRNKKGRCVKI